MQLEVNGVIYTSHFVHGMRETKCILHKGECKGRECIDKYLDSEVEGVVSVGEARCNTNDQFSKAKGRILSLTRAMANQTETKSNSELRKYLWARYFSIAPRKR